MKAASLHRLRVERPDVTLVTTMNAEANIAMRAVNARLGFRVTAIYTTCVLNLRVDAPSSL